jgi:hypothetical protein
MRETSGFQASSRKKSRSTQGWFYLLFQGRLAFRATGQFMDGAKIEVFGCGGVDLGRKAHRSN